MRVKMLAAALALPAVLAGCASVGPGAASSRSGDLRVRGERSAEWSDGDSTLPLNFTLVYETTAWHGKAAQPFHRMRTEVRLSYDPVTSRIRNARLSSSGPGTAYRDVCIGPRGRLLHVRVTTYFENRSESLTVLDFNGSRKAFDGSADVGVGPADGLVESFDVLFKKDGTYEISPDTKAYLAGAGLRIERRMNDGPNLKRLVKASYP